MNTHSKAKLTALSRAEMSHRILDLHRPVAQVAAGFVAIDDHSRRAFAQLFPDETTASAIAFLHAAQAFLQKHGTQAQRVYSKNGSCYRIHTLPDAVAVPGLQHLTDC
jgi:hypothetical protein